MRKFSVKEWIMDNVDRSHIERLLKIHRSNLQVLEVEAAQVGSIELPLDLNNRISHEKSEIANLIEDAIRSLKRLNLDRRIDGRIQIRIYNALPSLQLYIYDNRALVGFFLHGSKSNLAPQLEVEVKDSVGGRTYFGRYVEGEFEKIWNKSMDIIEFEQYRSLNSS
jgi:hypothetical protein